MARVDSLGHFLTDVADAIRTKKGTSNPIIASNFDTEISNLSGGVDLDDYIKATPTETNYGTFRASLCLKKLPSITISSSYSSLQSAFSSCMELQEIQGIVNNSTTTNASSMFYDCKNLTSIPTFNTSYFNNASNMFYQCFSLTTIPILDFSSVTTATNMFSYSGIVTVPQIDLSNVKQGNYLFGNCQKLENVPEFNMPRLTAMSNMFVNCFFLTDASLNNIMKLCISATSYTGTKTLNTIGISSSQATRCQSLSNYQAFLNAGWTTGY